MDLVHGPGFCQSPLALDEDCTVTVGNQTALVNPDGSFLSGEFVVAWHSRGSSNSDSSFMSYSIQGQRFAADLLSPEGGIG